jgi:hypothetical protein
MAFLPRNVPVITPVSPAGGVAVALYAGAVRYCRRVVRAGGEASKTPPGGDSFSRFFELAPCVAVEGGGMRGAAFGLRHNGSAVGGWLAPELGLTALGQLARHFALSVEVDGLVPVVRAAFHVDTTIVYKAGPATARGLLALRVTGW